MKTLKTLLAMTMAAAVAAPLGLYGHRRCSAKRARRPRMSRRTHAVGPSGSAGHLLERRRDRHADGAARRSSRASAHESLTRRGAASGSSRSATTRSSTASSGDEFAGGLRPPTHLIFDTFDRKNRRAWLVVDPPDGRIPPLTEAARKRPRVPGRRQHQRQPERPVQQLARHGALRSLHHARHPRVDDAGRLRQPLRDRAVARQRGHPLRDDSRDARHPVRSASAGVAGIRQYLGDARALVGGRHAGGRDAELPARRRRRSAPATRW